MHTGTLKKWALALTFWLALHMASLKAQTIPFQLTAGSGGTAVDFEWRLDGSIIEEGAGATSTLSDADLESSSRFIWYPALSALRAGTGLSTETVSQVGEQSVAFGYHSIASGTVSTALGYNTTASGGEATALGYVTAASGEFSTALGYYTTASGAISMARGLDATASGEISMAMGLVALASGYCSTALGYYTTASGYYTLASGVYTHANALDSFTTGTHNAGGGSATSWVTTDPLFEVGNGGDGTTLEHGWAPINGNPYASTAADAFVVYKNGNATVQGTLSAHTGARTAPGGDLSMGSFTAGTAP